MVVSRLVDEGKEMGCNSIQDTKLDSVIKKWSCVPSLTSGMPFWHYAGYFPKKKSELKRINAIFIAQNCFFVR
jgi:hypothetical protein